MITECIIKYIYSAAIDGPRTASQEEGIFRRALKEAKKAA